MDACLRSGAARRYCQRDGHRHERISSPILSKYDIAVVLNQPSLDKFEPKIKPGGVLIYDSYGVLNPPTRKDITVYRIDAMDKAAEMKNSKVFNTRRTAQGGSRGERQGCGKGTL